MTTVVARYLGADLLRSQRFIIPVFVYLAVTAVLLGGDPGPPPTPWAATTLVLYPVSAWLAITTVNAEDPVQRQVTVAAAGGWARVCVGILVTCLAGDGVLVAFSVLRPLIPVATTPYHYPAALLLAGALAHVAGSTTGTAVGLLCTRPLINRLGWSLMSAVTIVLLTATAPWLPPVGAAAEALSTPNPPWATLAACATLGVLLAGLACVVTILVSRLSSAP